MSQKIYRVTNLENHERNETHEYTITVTTNKEGHEEYVMSRSNDSIWSEHARGEQLIKLVETGDEIIFPKKQFVGDVQYDTFAELFILLNFMSKTSRMPLYKGKIELVTPQDVIEI